MGTKLTNETPGRLSQVFKILSKPVSSTFKTVIVGLPVLLSWRCPLAASDAFAASSSAAARASRSTARRAAAVCATVRPGLNRSIRSMGSALLSGVDGAAEGAGAADERLDGLPADDDGNEDQPVEVEVDHRTVLGHGGTGLTPSPL